MTYKTRIIRIIGKSQIDLLVKLIPELPTDGTIEVVVREYRRSATNEQRSVMWIRISEVAEQGYVGGKKFSGAAWHEHFKAGFLPEEFTEGITKDGYVKWADSPSGRKLVGSTEMLTMRGKALHTQQIEAFGAGELGVQFSELQRDER